MHRNGQRAQKEIEKMSNRVKAYKVYLKAVRKFGSETTTDLNNAARWANDKGYNWTVDFQDEWYRAIREA